LSLIVVRKGLPGSLPEGPIFRNQPGDHAASGAEAFPPQLPPDLAHAIDAEVLLEHAPDLDLQISVSADPVGQTEGSARLARWA